MLQRIQTVYMLVVAIFAGVFPFWLNLWTDAAGQEIYAQNDLMIFPFSMALRPLR